MKRECVFIYIYVAKKNGIMLKTVKFYVNKIPFLFLIRPSFKQSLFLNTTSEKDCFAYSQTFSKTRTPLY